MQSPTKSCFKLSFNATRFMGLSIMHIMHTYQLLWKLKLLLLFCILQHHRRGKFHIELFFLDKFHSSTGVVGDPIVNNYLHQTLKNVKSEEEKYISSGCTLCGRDIGGPTSCKKCKTLLCHSCLPLHIFRARYSSLPLLCSLFSIFSWFSLLSLLSLLLFWSLLSF